MFNVNVNELEYNLVIYARNMSSSHLMSIRSSATFVCLYSYTYDIWLGWGPTYNPSLNLCCTHIPAERQIAEMSASSLFLSRKNCDDLNGLKCEMSKRFIFNQVQ